MKVVETERYVPAKTYIDKKYVASDGKEFMFERDCLRYEEELAIANHPVYKSAISGVYTFYDEYGAVLFYISSKEDLDFFMKMQGIDKDGHYFYTDFYDCGKGWYLYWVEDGGDYPDENYLKNYNAYVQSIGSDLRDYNWNMKCRMSQAEYDFKLKGGR